MSKVYVGGLKPDMPERDLEDEFRRFGKIAKFWVARKPPGFAFIDFEDPRDAEDAVRKLDGYQGWRVEISRSRGPAPRGGPGGGDRGDRGGPPPPRGGGPGGRGDMAGGAGGPPPRGGGGGGRFDDRDPPRGGDRSRLPYSPPRGGGRSRSRSPPPRRSPSPRGRSRSPVVRDRSRDRSRSR